MKGLMNKVLHSDGFLYSSALFAVGAGAAAILNYLFHLFVGRLLGPEEYGILGTLLVIANLASITIGGVSTTISKFTSALDADNEPGRVKYLLVRATRKSILWGGIILIAYGCMSPFIAHFLNMDSISPVILVGAISYLTLIGTTLGGLLNGLRMFVWQNTTIVLNPVFKFSLAILFIELGYGVGGALGAVLVGALVAVAIATYPLYRNLRGVRPIRFDTSSIYHYLLMTTGATLLLTLLITVDQVLVKHYLTPTNAGYYTAAGVIGKTIWYGSGFLTLSFFPNVARQFAQGKTSSGLLRKCLLFTLLLSAIGCAIYLTVPHFIVSFLYGNRYQVIAPVILVFGLAMGMYSLICVLVSYNLAIEQYKFIWLLALAITIETVGIALFHDSIADVIRVVFGTAGLLLLAMLFYNWKDLFTTGGATHRNL